MDRRELTKAQREDLARFYAAKYLDEVNANSELVKPRANTFYVRVVKRAFDIIIALVALIVTLPINIVIGIVTFFDVGRPIFFLQERTGKDGKLFKIVKFRNMTNATNEKGELLPAAQRVTKWGKFVRKTSLDELLNFWSIFKGDMSLIGPRPLVSAYSYRYSNRHAQRMAVRPGLECPPRSRDIVVRSWHDQLENDVWYVENVSFLTDCKMFFYLVYFTLDRKSANARAEIGRGTFVGYGPDGKAINMADVPQEYIDYYDEKNAEIREPAVRK